MTNVNYEFLSKIYDDDLSRKIIEVISLDITDEEKIKILVNFMKGEKE